MALQLSNESCAVIGWKAINNVSRGSSADPESPHIYARLCVNELTHCYHNETADKIQLKTNMGIFVEMPLKFYVEGPLDTRQNWSCGSISLTIFHRNMSPTQTFMQYCNSFPAHQRLRFSTTPQQQNCRVMYKMLGQPRLNWSERKMKFPWNFKHYLTHHPPCRICASVNRVSIVSDNDDRWRQAII